MRDHQIRRSSGAFPVWEHWLGTTSVLLKIVPYGISQFDRALVREFGDRFTILAVDHSACPSMKSVAIHVI